MEKSAFLKYVWNMTYEEAQKNAQTAYETFRRAIGPTVCRYLDRDDWTDLSVLSDGSIFLDTSYDHKVEGKADSRGMAAAARTIAQYTGQSFNNHDSQNLNATIPVIGLRVAFLGPPAVEDVVMDIRRLPKYVFPPEDLLKAGSFTQNQYDFLVDAVGKFRNIVFSGATGSGKTTIANSFMTKIDPSGGRIYVVEDTKEINLTQGNKINILVNPDFSYRKAIEASLRFNFRRLIIGECRNGDQVLEMFKAWNTGHPGGFTTIHANSVDEVFARLDKLLGENGFSTSQVDWIRESVDVVVHMTRTIDNRRVVGGMYDVREDRYVE